MGVVHVLNTKDDELLLAWHSWSFGAPTVVLICLRGPACWRAVKGRYCRKQLSARIVGVSCTAGGITSALPIGTFSPVSPLSLPLSLPSLSLSQKHFLPLPTAPNSENSAPHPSIPAVASVHKRGLSCDAYTELHDSPLNSFLQGWRLNSQLSLRWK